MAVCSALAFHQGMIIRIDREDGSWQPVLEGLDHPHSVRILADDDFTVADTGRGRGLMIHLKNGKGEIEAEVDANTNWLQDCVYDQHHDQWVMVDGKTQTLHFVAALRAERRSDASISIPSGACTRYCHWVACQLND